MNVTKATPLSVSEYAARVQRAAKEAGSARVEGEVQRPRKTRGGVLMFDLTDGDSRLPCKVLPWVLRAGITHDPAEGDLVQVEAEYPDFWPEGGWLNILVSDIELAGDGELLKRRKELITRLKAEGLTDPDGFTPLPRFPRGVGVIAGADSSALHDVIACLGERFPAAKVITACCQVQGARAPKGVIEALAALELHPEIDVILIVRGGGSVKDLATFDDERLCRAIRAISTPTITAIGHTDNDPVCNQITHAAYVPRHAAERAVPNRVDLLAELDEAVAAADRTVERHRRTAEDIETRCRSLRALARVRATRAEIAERGKAIDRETQAFLAEHLEVLNRAREPLTRTPERLRAEIKGQCGTVDLFAPAALRCGRSLKLKVEALDAQSEQLRLGGRRLITTHKTNWANALDRHGRDLIRAGRRSLGDLRAPVDAQAEALARGGQHQLRERVRRAEALIGVSQASDFRRQGWLRASDTAGKAVTTVTAAEPGDALRLLLLDGELDTVVKDVHHDHESRNDE